MRATRNEQVLEEEVQTNGHWEAVRRLDKDLRQAARTMGRRDVRYLVDTYYQIQHNRITAANQIRSGEGEPHRVLDWLLASNRTLEDDIRKALGEFAGAYTVGRWALSVCGIGPVITAGLLAHLDVRLAKTVGHFWRFAGLDPTLKWEKGQKRPYNARLKTLCAFKIGESFIKVQNRDGDYYGKLYRARKDLEIRRNGEGYNVPAAKAALEAKRIGKATEAYKWYSQGLLPPAHLHARARRWAVKLFLAHLHQVMHEDYYGEMPPKPWVFEHEKDTDHRHFLTPPGWPVGELGKPLKDLLGGEG